ncbi:lambda phage CII family protein, partial [Salmonella enterica subsp. enterica serovar Anatum]|nr:lambda phage CII family protein [Salmonella enterica subsp. enterica serovar Anatum]
MRCERTQSRKKRRPLQRRARKKANAITSSILNRIAIRGQRKVADALGINESQISRWKGDF